MLRFLCFSFSGTTSIRISDRYGEIFDDFSAPGKDKFLEWHKDGDFLAVVGGQAPHVTLYTMSTKESNEVDLGLASKWVNYLQKNNHTSTREIILTFQNCRESPTFCIWSDSSPVLVVATNRGNVFFLNVLTSRKTPVMGKHQRAITTGAFNSEGLLALGSEDATITISNPQGDTVNSFGCNTEPESIYYIPIYDDYEKDLKEYFVASVLNKKTLMIASALATDAPVNLQFQVSWI